MKKKQALPLSGAAYKTFLAFGTVSFLAGHYQYYLISFLAGIAALRALGLFVYLVTKYNQYFRPKEPTPEQRAALSASLLAIYSKSENEPEATVNRILSSLSVADFHILAKELKGRKAEK